MPSTGRFPVTPTDAQLVVTGHALDSPRLDRAMRALGRRAERVTGGHGSVTVDVARDGRTAVVSVPFPDIRLAAQRACGRDAAPDRRRHAWRSPDRKVMLTGDAAGAPTSPVG